MDTAATTQAETDDKEAPALVVELPTGRGVAVGAAVGAVVGLVVGAEVGATVPGITIVFT